MSARTVRPGVARGSSRSRSLGGLLSGLAMLLATALQAGAEAGPPGSDWHRLESAGEVALWVQRVPGSRYPWFRARRRLRASLRSLVDLLANPRARPSWFYACQAARSLEVRGREGWAYTEIDAPWPARDRDNVLHWKAEQTPAGVVRIELSNDPERLPHVSGRVRLHELRGSWRLAPLASGEIEVTFDLRMVPDTPLPSSFVLPFLRAIPFESLRSLPEALATNRSPSVSRWVREPEAASR